MSNDGIPVYDWYYDPLWYSIYVEDDLDGEEAGPDTFHCGGEEYHLHYLDGVIPVYVPYEDEGEEE